MAWSVVLLLSILNVAGLDEPQARVRVTHRDLIPTCLNAAAVAPGKRSWNLEPGRFSMVLTMKQKERAGPASPGLASISFDVEAGHRYEIEVRAPTEAFSSRVWRRGEWTPVVRDRTTERIVSATPEWIEGPCAVPR